MIHDDQHDDGPDRHDHFDRKDHLVGRDGHEATGDGYVRMARDLGCPPELSRMLETLRAVTVDTGHAATQHAVDAALVALEDALIRLAGSGAKHVARGDFA